MAKEYKPGQFVSICGKLHRIKEEKVKHPCRQCPYDKSPRIGKEFTCVDCIGKLTYRQYPEPVKHK